jgi:hypothetical protein
MKGKLSSLVRRDFFSRLSTLNIVHFEDQKQKEPKRRKTSGR